MPVSSPEFYAPSLSLKMRARLPYRLALERWQRRLIAFGAASVFIAVAAIPAFLLIESWPLGASIGSLWSALLPLMLGTLRAAVFALLLALPLGLGAAIYSAQFSASGVRSTLKPALEILEGIPTVVLGLIAALWLAPWLYLHVARLLMLLLCLPLLALGCAVLSRGLVHLGTKIQTDKWRIFILLVLFVLATSVIVRTDDATSASWLHAWFDPGSPWNALLVGLTLGLAIIPTVFSVAEDALFSVPSALAHGAYALGATRTQALTHLILRSASPGLLAAALLGFGRAVGETMIVLMASGNTPTTGFSALQGLRSVAANLALEAPEAAAGSSAYRLLLISALLLFTFTFLVNSAAELVRERLRRRYAQL